MKARKLTLLKLCFVFLAGFILIRTDHTRKPSAESRVLETLASLPISFEPNRGQTDPSVRFLARGPSYTMFLTADQAVLSLLPGKNKETPEQKPEVVRLKLVGTNPAAEVHGIDELPGKSNYYIGDDPANWRTNIPSYEKVQYDSLYPGIDLVYYGNQGSLEFDFNVAAGANPDIIQFEVDGFDRLEIDEAGNLAVGTGSGRVSLRKPTAYQEDKGARSEIALDYELIGTNRVGFRVGSYDATQPLVLDPFLWYSTYLGGSSEDRGLAISTFGDTVAVTGTTSSANFPTAVPIQASNAGTYDAFVLRLDPQGVPIFSTYFGGSSNDFSTAIAMTYDIFVTGHTVSSNFPTMTPIQPSNAGGSDVFVARFTRTGALLYSTYLGGTLDDHAYGIAFLYGFGSVSDVVVTGHTLSTNFPTMNAIQSNNAGGVDAFVTAFNPTAGFLLNFSTYLGGNADDFGLGITTGIGSIYHIYVTGQTFSTNFPTLLPFQPSLAGSSDAFMTQFDATGGLLYSTYLGGSADDAGNGIAADTNGNAYVTGQTLSTNFPTVLPLQAFNAGGIDAFITKFDLYAGLGTLGYSTYLGGSDNDSGNGIAVDSPGNAHVTGYTLSANFPLVNAIQETNGGSADAFVTKVTPTGFMDYSTYLGGQSQDYAYGISVDDLTGRASVVGQTASTNFPNVNAFQPASGGSFDVFAALVDGGTCVLASAMKDVIGGSSILTTMYRFRDGVMLQSSNGKRYVDLFYKHTAEGSRILLKDPVLRQKVVLLLSRHQPTFKTLVDRRTATVRADEVKEIDALIGAFMERGSRAFSADLAPIRQGLRDRSLLAQFGVRLTD